MMSIILDKMAGELNRNIENVHLMENEGEGALTKQETLDKEVKTKKMKHD